MPPKKKPKVHTFTRVQTLVALGVGVVAIVTALATSFQWIGSFIVTHNDLVIMEKRITDKFTEESIVIRTTYIADLEEQKTKLNALLMGAKTIGELEVYKIQINTLNERIETLRGK